MNLFFDSIQITD